MREWVDFTTEDQDEGKVRIAFSGPMTVSSLGPAEQRLRGLDREIGVLDLSAVSEIDTVGAWLTWRISRDNSAEIHGASEQALRLIDAVKGSSGSPEAPPVRVPIAAVLPEAVGKLVSVSGSGLVGIMGFFGAVLVSSWNILRHPSRMRGQALARQLELVGVTALPIVGLMCFLVGIVIAQQGAVQLKEFGAEILTVNLTGRISMRELGVLMTAIMVAGRSGSAFAAQIGTMKLTEEIDAMRTIGVSPIEALVIPRILASVVMMPLLGFYAACVAIIGGAFISAFTLGIPFDTFLMRIREVLPLHDVWVGLVKAPFFGLIIGMAGCYQGMQVKADAEEVGLRTTMAVVQAIFMVIVMDAFFAVFFTEVGWG
jgi:phospholipid/cholesterol/gamma-HCH transport system permease protein